MFFPVLRDFSAVLKNPRLTTRQRPWGDFDEAPEGWVQTCEVTCWWVIWLKLHPSSKTNESPANSKGKDGLPKHFFSGRFVSFKGYFPSHLPSFVGWLWVNMVWWKHPILADWGACECLFCVIKDDLFLEVGERQMIERWGFVKTRGLWYRNPWFGKATWRCGKVNYQPFEHHLNLMKHPISLECFLQHCREDTPEAKVVGEGRKMTGCLERLPWSSPLRLLHLVSEATQYSLYKGSSQQPYILPSSKLHHLNFVVVFAKRHCNPLQQAGIFAIMFHPQVLIILLYTHLLFRSSSLVCCHQDEPQKNTHPFWNPHLFWNLTTHFAPRDRFENFIHLGYAAAGLALTHPNGFTRTPREPTLTQCAQPGATRGGGMDVGGGLGCLGHRAASWVLKGRHPKIKDC